MYRAVFSPRARKAFLDLSKQQAERVKETVEKLTNDPRSHGTIKLESAPVAQYRRRVGNLRILFDIDDGNKTVEILDIRQRSERTYR